MTTSTRLHLYPECEFCADNPDHELAPSDSPAEIESSLSAYLRSARLGDQVIVLIPSTPSVAPAGYELFLLDGARKDVVLAALGRGHRLAATTRP